MVSDGQVDTLLSSTDYADEAAQRIVDAALAEFAERGLRKVSVDDIARRAGIHRVTVYRRFANKDEIVMAAAIAWLQRFFREVAEAVSDPDDPESALAEGFAISVLRMREEPIVARALAKEPDYAMPFLSGELALATVRSIFATQLRRSIAAQGRERDIDVDGVAELFARTGLSFLITPASQFSMKSREEIEAFARRYLVPMLRAYG
jgi:AcrR family transcriptional regulator